MDNARPLGQLERRLHVAGFAFYASYFSARVMVTGALNSDTTRLLVAFAPLIAFGWFMVACFRYVREMDEMQRLIQLQALAFAFPCSVAFMMTLGLLERAFTTLPHALSYRVVWLYLPFFYYAALWIARRKYK